jgi:hypothetical protein
MEENVEIYLGDCLEELRSIPDNSMDSIVTDPPYGLSNQPDMMEVLRHWMAGDDYGELPPAYAGGFPFHSNLWSLHGRSLSVPGRQKLIASFGNDGCAVVIGVEGGSTSLADKLGLGLSVERAGVAAARALLARIGGGN